MRFCPKLEKRKRSNYLHRMKTHIVNIRSRRVVLPLHEHEFYPVVKLQRAQTSNAHVEKHAIQNSIRHMF